MISVIVAVARGGVIGVGNRMPWHISEDLRRFKAITTGHPVVMGRRTWESLGRPLPGRVNVVITHHPDFVPESGGEPVPDVKIAGSLTDAVAMFPPEEEVFVIGGGEIYRQAMQIADRFYLTEIDLDIDGDTWFPDWNPAQWNETFTERHPRGVTFPHPFTFRNFIRKK